MSLHLHIGHPYIYPASAPPPGNGRREPACGTSGAVEAYNLEAFSVLKPAGQVPPTAFDGKPIDPLCEVCLFVFEALGPIERWILPTGAQDVFRLRMFVGKLLREARES